MTAKSLAVLGSLAIASPALATNGMRMIGFGPVQNSMGGASVAAPLDTSTAITNPAGLTALDKRADLAGTYFNPTVKYSATGAASGQSKTSDRSPDVMPTAGFAWGGLAPNLALGIGVAGVAGMGVDYKADLMGSKTMTSYSNMRVAPAAAYEVVPGLSLGVAVNLMWAQMKYGFAGSQPPDGPAMQPRPAQDAFGWGATVGVQYKPIDLLTVGAAYETVSDFQDFEWSIPAHTNYLAGAPMAVPGGKEKLAFDQPQMFTFGVGVKPVPVLLVAADVEWINWSATMGKDKPKFGKSATDQFMTTGAMAFNMDWSDQWVFKLGAQVEATKDLKIRAGYNYGKSPLNASRAFENVAFPAIAEHHVTLGAGYDFGRFSLNLAGVYVPEAKLTGGNADQGIPAYTTKMSQLEVDVGLSFRM
jgi:long-chain fatty acid transport protein